MKAYSEDLRKKILQAVDRGMPKSEAARTFARTRETLIEAMGRALDAVTARDARGFFEHRGYTVYWLNRYDKRSRLLIQGNP